MFEQTFVDEQVQTKKPWMIVASGTMQTGAVAVILLIPLLRLETIQPNFEIPPVFYVAKLAPPPPAEYRAMKLIRAPRLNRAFVAPTHIPRTIDMTPDATPDIAIGFVLPFDAIAGIPDHPLSSQPLARPAPPIADVKPAPQTTLRVSEGLQSAKLIFGPKPPYPQLARTARVQGTVKLQAIIARDGGIKNLKATAGPALLIQAAMDAVRQWRYQPTLLNGIAVEIETEVDVIFTLN